MGLDACEIRPRVVNQDQPRDERDYDARIESMQMRLDGAHGCV